MYRILITGATGLLGRRIVAQVLEAGHQVVATGRRMSQLEQPSSNRLSTFEGDLTEADFVDSLTRQVDGVIHCAAKTTNWGKADEFELGNIVTTRNLVDACDRHDVARFVHISSIAVYGHPDIQGRKITESDPIGQHLLTYDRYNQSKIAAERTALRLGQRTVILRPTWFIGPGDKTFVPSVIRKLKKGAVWIIGSGKNELNGISVDDVANGAILAATNENVGGQIFNLCSDGEITQQQFLDIICEHQRIKKVRRKIPSSVAWAYAYLVEHYARMTNPNAKPPVTRHDLTVFARPAKFSSQKAKEILQWHQTKTLEQALRETLAADNMSAHYPSPAEAPPDA